MNDIELGEYLLKLIREQKQICPVSALVGNTVIANGVLHESFEIEIEKVQKEIGRRNKKGMREEVKIMKQISKALGEYLDEQICEQLFKIKIPAKNARNWVGTELKCK